MSQEKQRRSAVTVTDETVESEAYAARIPFDDDGVEGEDEEHQAAHSDSTPPDVE